MDYGKYIIIDGGSFEQVIMFDNTISHDTFKELFNILSAGMFVVSAKPNKNDSDDISVSVFGESVTLNLEVRRGKDERLIKRVLRKNLW